MFNDTHQGPEARPADRTRSAERLRSADRLRTSGWPQAPSGADFDFVTDRIATGGAIWDEEDVTALQAAGITHVVTAAIELEEETRRALAGRLVHLANGVDDDGLWKSPTWFRRSIDFTLAALADPDARVLLHCGAGINRGPSSAYAVLRALGHSPSEAYRLITDARPIACVLYANDADEAIEVLGLGGGRSRDAGSAAPREDGALSSATHADRLRSAAARLGTPALATVSQPTLRRVTR